MVMGQNVLVVGSGGREHALSWKLARSPLVDAVYTAPGNGGTACNVPIAVDQLEDLARYAKKHNCFTVVGPEAPLAAGISETFARYDLPLFGPTQAAARLEYSKVWAKDFMSRNGIQTARYRTFTDPDTALQSADMFGYPVAIKADGLAAGKGVVVCDTHKQAGQAIRDMMIDTRFGAAGQQIVIEEGLQGAEMSYIAICDGDTLVPMVTSQDYKRIYDKDRGPNTGGMGACSPAEFVDDTLVERIHHEIMERTVLSMKREGHPFAGFLYAGIMIRNGEPYVLEYNVRMGDPECQPIMLRMKSDLYEYLRAASSGTLDAMPPVRWHPDPSVCVVLASRGYPGPYTTGQAITLPDNIHAGAQIFHAGTKRQDGVILSDGGRVLGVTALGDTIPDAAQNAYDIANSVQWDQKYCRGDIGLDRVS